MASTATAPSVPEPAPAPAPVPASVDLFGPSNALYPLVLTYLPDVLSRIVVHYACPLYPRQHNYAGNAIMQPKCHAAFNTRTASTLASASAASAQRPSGPGRLSLLASPFSLSGPLTVCGWLCRLHADDASFLLSAHSNGLQANAAGEPALSLGYPEPRHGTTGATLSACFNCLLSLRSSASFSAEPCWEHIALTFQPQPQQPESGDEPAAMDDEDSAAPQSPQQGAGRLYHNGRTVSESQCWAPLVGSDFHLLLGRHDTNPRTPSMRGGLCDVRIYSRALDEDEVRALFDGADGSTEGLEVRWRLDATHGADELFVRDSSGHARHALLPGQSLDVSVTGSAGGAVEAQVSTQNEDAQPVSSTRRQHTTPG